MLASPIFKLLAGLATQGFSQPTAIQQEVWPAAVHEDADVMGAAETVSTKAIIDLVDLTFF